MREFKVAYDIMYDKKSESLVDTKNSVFVLALRYGRIKNQYLYEVYTGDMNKMTTKSFYVPPPTKESHDCDDDDDDNIYDNEMSKEESVIMPMDDLIAVVNNNIYCKTIYLKWK